MSPIIISLVPEVLNGNFNETASHEGYEYLKNNSADLLGYFLPDYSVAKWWGYEHIPSGDVFSQSLLEASFGDRLGKTVYPGWTSWIFLVISICIPDIRKRFWPWITLAAFSFIWTLGPTLFINGHPYLDGLLPARFIKDIPLFNLLRAPTRFSFFIPFVSGLLVSYVISKITKVSMAKSFLVSLIVFSLALFEFFPINQKIFPKNIFESSFYSQLKNEDNDLAVLNIPVDFHGARGGGDIYVYAQTVHEKPIIGGYVTYAPNYVFDTLNTHPILIAVEHHEYDQDKRLRLDSADFSEIKNILVDLNIGYVILHKHLLRNRDYYRLLSILGGQLGSSIYEDHLIVAFSSAKP